LTQKKTNSITVFNETKDEDLGLLALLLLKRNYSISRYTKKIVYLIKKRANFVSEFFGISDFFCLTEYDPKAPKTGS
jgi:hypothetical protein